MFQVKCTSNAIFRINPAVGLVDKDGTATVKVSCADCWLTFISGQWELQITVHKQDNYREDGAHQFSIYHIKIADDYDTDKNGRKAWAEHKGDAEGHRRMPVNWKRVRSTPIHVHRESLC